MKEWMITAVALENDGGGEGKVSKGNYPRPVGAHGCINIKQPCLGHDAAHHHLPTTVTVISVQTVVRAHLCAKLCFRIRLRIFIWYFLSLVLGADDLRRGAVHTVFECVGNVMVSSKFVIQKRKCLRYQGRLLRDHISGDYIFICKHM